MGNIKHFGGGLTQAWHSDQYDLQIKILNRLSELGIAYVLPAFAGFIPNAFKRWNKLLLVLPIFFYIFLILDYIQEKTFPYRMIGVGFLVIIAGKIVFLRKFTRNIVILINCWSLLLLDPSDPLFLQVGSAYLKKVRKTSSLGFYLTSFSSSHRLS